MDSLKKYLAKLGIGSIEELNPQERRQYEEWKRSLQGRKLTDEDVGEFLDGQRQKCIDKLRYITELSDEEKIFFSMQLDLIENIEGFLSVPKLERAMAERELGNLNEL